MSIPGILACVATVLVSVWIIWLFQDAPAWRVIGPLCMAFCGLFTLAVSLKNLYRICAEIKA